MNELVYDVVGTLAGRSDAKYAAWHESRKSNRRVAKLSQILFDALPREESLLNPMIVGVPAASKELGLGKMMEPKAIELLPNLQAIAQDSCSRD